MDLITWNLKLPLVSPINLKEKIIFRFCNHPLQFNHLRNKPFSISITHAKKKKNLQLDSPVLQPSFTEEVTKVDDDEEFEEDDDLLITDDFDDEEFLEDDGDEGYFEDGDEAYFEDDYDTENAETYAGDGAEGGGISLAGTWWDKEALTIAENVTDSFDGVLGMYAFRTLANARIQIRIEKLTTKYGSPSISDIEAFSTAYRTRLDEAELAKTVPENLSLEVSSPGLERVIRIPQELGRFKEKPMYVRYVTNAADSSSENDGVFRLVSFDLETECCTWGLADVRINREKAGKGRPMSKKQREWRLTTPFDSIRLARVYTEI
ncbi:uncharacterized protein LOC110735781 [Chenopodium quinoa]|uniref:uncharacterized protein LOC110735781 n=1 Tax=Chenopodium quinoa TaxID=63459 RepID=UPI000B7844B8|nr:uncharacterized protein LOC110735781 [Chenopodium quinoa]